ncbi:DUF6090 family protein [Mangrovimonas sp. TPBH4]|uniref:DUF6090 family protein n=1 Tax=Mangrovimonas sp. TPBH4 TaxID=1645914 RepID=UPI0006B514DD|nr:DUF6090 family protein [Mangrovimonas sp. TPBH4]
MFLFFKNLRHHLLSQNKLRKYLLYAFGEIILVVTGILIALYINNWNREQEQEKEFTGYYQAIQKELNLNLAIIKLWREDNNGFIDSFQKELPILNSKNLDTADPIQNILVHLTTVGFPEPPLPIIDRFQNSQYLAQIKSDTLLFYFTKLSFVRLQTKNFIKADFDINNTIIQPYVLKHIDCNQPNIMTGKKFTFPDGPPTNYKHLSNNFEFWNIAQFKLILLYNYLELLDQLIQTMESINLQIDIELEKRGVDLKKQSTNAKKQEVSMDSPLQATN